MPWHRTGFFSSITCAERATEGCRKYWAKTACKLDVIARTIGLNRIARAEWENIPDETGSLLTSFSAGINALIERSQDCLPIEFALLDYEPEPWSPVDCLAIASEFRYYLTVRFPVIVGPELARRALGDDELFAAFMIR